MEEDAECLLLVAAPPIWGDCIGSSCAARRFRFSARCCSFCCLARSRHLFPLTVFAPLLLSGVFPSLFAVQRDGQSLPMTASEPIEGSSFLDNAALLLQERKIRSFVDCKKGLCETTWKMHTARKSKWRGAGTTYCGRARRPT